MITINPKHPPTERFEHFTTDEGEIFRREREIFNGKILIEKAVLTTDGVWLKYAHYQDRPEGKPVSGVLFQRYIKCFADEVLKYA